MLLSLHQTFSDLTMFFRQVSCCFFFGSSLTPLHIASEKSHLDAVELLIKNGAKVPTTY